MLHHLNVCTVYWRKVCPQFLYFKTVMFIKENAETCKKRKSLKNKTINPLVCLKVNNVRWFNCFYCTGSQTFLNSSTICSLNVKQTGNILKLEYIVQYFVLIFELCIPGCAVRL